ncbi:MAG: protein translocase subunit SecF, partial [Bacilli bacterium]|nr:protein translocase subunit SecF [Bacilli bacterium]
LFRSYELISTILNQNGLSAASDQNSGADAIIVRYQNSVSEGDNLVVDYNTPEMAEEMIAINNTVEQQVEDAFILKYGTNIQIQANAEMINATASSDLLKKAALSVGIAMLLMLIYTAIRFDLFSGIAALSMQINDIIIMLSFVIIFRIQINSSLIAGLITIVAYSINNTLLIFDRVRDNIKLIRTQNLRIIPGEIVDTSVNQCLTRALFTSFTTLLTISILASMGIKSLSDFALPIIFGILSGLYSSLFLAPSIWGLLMQAKLKNEIKKAKALKTQKR